MLRPMSMSAVNRFMASPSPPRCTEAMLLIMSSEAPGRPSPLAEALELVRLSPAT